MNSCSLTGHFLFSSVGQHFCMLVVLARDLSSQNLNNEEQGRVKWFLQCAHACPSLPVNVVIKLQSCSMKSIVSMCCGQPQDLVQAAHIVCVAALLAFNRSKVLRLCHLRCGPTRYCEDFVSQT
eukprot:2849955-Amphidinium_carterae.1